MKTVMIEMTEEQARCFLGYARMTLDDQALYHAQYGGLEERIEELSAIVDTIQGAIDNRTKRLVQNLIGNGCTYQEAKEIAA